MDLTSSPAAPASRAPLAVLRRYAAARRALCETDIAEYCAGVNWETPEFSAANREAYEARVAVPWWLRPAAAVIGWHVVAELDYFRRTGQ